MSAFRHLLPAVLSLCPLLLGSCQTVTPASRISQNPVMYKMLSPEQQVMVQQGRICEGMTKDAVYLAWGNPNSQPIKGQQNGQAYEKWVYLVYRPVMVDSVGFGGGCCHHHGPWYCGSGISTSTAMVPTEAAWVMFQNDVVTAWESRQ